MPSIFTQIIEGSIPSHKIYEDDRTYAFLDIHPALEGHTLVVPKTEVEFVWDLADTDYRALMETTKKIAVRLRSITGTPYVAELVIGVDVPHAHVQLIPFADASELQRVLGNEDRPTDHEALAQLAARLAF